jgi:hypothetical protein
MCLAKMTGRRTENRAHGAMMLALLSGKIPLPDKER